MAKAKKSPKTPTGDAAPGNRRAQLRSFEEARRKDARRRTIILLLVCVVLAGGLLSVPIYLSVQDFQARNRVITDLGTSLADAGCDAPVQDPATGNQNHVPDGTKVDYAQTPPDSGAHYDTPAPFTKRFYDTSDRPAVETLVHNLEHGYTVVWYRADAPADQIEALEGISKTFTATEYSQTDKFIAAPWAASDGEGFPAGKNVVMARWTANPQSPADQAQQRGVRQACTNVSGAAVQAFMAQYPATAAPEPNGA